MAKIASRRLKDFGMMGNPFLMAGFSLRSDMTPPFLNSAEIGINVLPLPACPWFLGKAGDACALALAHGVKITNETQSEEDLRIRLRLLLRRKRFGERLFPRVRTSGELVNMLALLWLARSEVF